MCGIVGMIGLKNVTPGLIDGLEKLEYRGYDSAGIFVSDAQLIIWSKHKAEFKIWKTK